MNMLTLLKAALRAVESTTNLSAADYGVHRAINDLHGDLMAAIADCECDSGLQGAARIEVELDPPPHP